MSHEEGIRLAAAGRLEEAAKVLLKYVEEKNPNDAAALNNLANVLSDLERPGEARVHYEKALELKPTFFEARRNYAALLSETGQREDAIEAYREALKYKEDADIHYNLGNLYSEGGDFVAAERHYRRSLAVTPTPHAHNNLGLLLHSRGQVHAAAAHYLEAIQLNPNSKDAKCNLGVSLRALGDSVGAMRRLEEAVMIDPECHKAHFQLGTMKQTMSLVSVAVDHLREAVRIAPAVPLYRVALLLALRTLHKKEDMNESMKGTMSRLARAAVGSGPSGTESARDLAMLLLLLGRRPDAARVLARLPPPSVPHPGPGPFSTASISLSRLPSRGGEVSQSVVQAWVQLRRRKAFDGLPAACVVRSAMDAETLDESIKETEIEAKRETGQGAWMLICEQLDKIEPIYIGLDPKKLCENIKPSQSCLLVPEVLPPLLVENRKVTIRMFVLISLHHGNFIFSEGVGILARKPYIPNSDDPEVHVTALAKQKDTSFDFSTSQILASSAFSNPAHWRRALHRASALAHSLASLFRIPDVAVDSASSQQQQQQGDEELHFQLISVDFAAKDDGEVSLLDISESANSDQGAYTKNVWRECVSPACGSVVDALGADGGGAAEVAPVGEGWEEWKVPESASWLQLRS